MKKKLLLFFISVLQVALLQGQVNLTVSAPANNGSTTGLRAPNGTSSQTTLRAHLIIPAAELTGIPSGTVIDEIGFLLGTGATGTASGNIEFYLENTTDATNLKSTTWSTAISTMTSVYNSTYNIPTTAVSVDFALSTSFTYTGGGLYVAYDYLGSNFATTGAVYLADNSLTASCFTGANATTTPETTLGATASAFRPEIRFTFVNPYTNDMAVQGLYTDKGKINNLIQTMTEAHAILKNNSTTTVTNLPVSLTVTGANSYSATQTIASIAPGAIDTLHFTNIPIVNLGSQSITVSVPSDNLTSNDVLVFDQEILCDTISHNNNGPINSGVGYNTGTGILANIYEIPASTIPIYVKKSTIMIATGTANVGNSIKGVLVNSSGVIVDSSAIHTITSAELGNPLHLTFINGNVDYSGQTIYVGIRQHTQTTGVGFFPCATQAPSVVKDSAYFGFGTNGGSLASYNTLGTFMLDAVLATAPVSLSSGFTNDSICAGTAVNLVATPLGFENYAFNTNGSMVQSSVANNYTFNASGTTTFNAVISQNACMYATDLDSLITTVDFNETFNESICTGETYPFDGQNLSSTGTYTALFSAIGGCDSNVVLNLTVNQTSSLTLNEEICQGDSYNFSNQNLTVSGTYGFTTTNAVGCDSVITLNLTVNPAAQTELNESICAGTTYFFNGQTLSSPGVYYEVNTGANGCDSVVTLNLSIENIDPSVSVSGDTLTANTANPNATFQWVDCGNNNSPIAGATSMMFKPGVTGSYAVIITQNGCTATSPCNTVDYTGLSEALLKAVEVYPNPAQSQLYINPNSMTLKEIKVFNMEGKEILVKTVSLNGIIQIDLGELENGTYILEFNTANAVGRKLFVKA